MPASCTCARGGSDIAAATCSSLAVGAKIIGSVVLENVSFLGSGVFQFSVSAGPVRTRSSYPNGLGAGLLFFMAVGGQDHLKGGDVARVVVVGPKYG